MKTKEQILWKHHVPKMHWKSFNEKRVLEAMEEYAKAYHEYKTRDTTCDHRYHNQNGRYMLYERYCEKCGKYLESNPTE